MAEAEVFPAADLEAAGEAVGELRYGTTEGTEVRKYGMDEDMGLGYRGIFWGMMIVCVATGGFWAGLKSVHAPAIAQVAMSFARLPVSGDLVSGTDRIVFSSGLQGKEFFDQVYATAGTIEHVNAVSAITAHHLLVADKIAALFAGLASDSVRTVVLISPNHFSVGRSVAQTSEGVWETPYGFVQSDADAVRKLETDVPRLKDEERTFVHEHGIAAITPFVARSFPNAKIVPLVLADSLTIEDARLLGSAVANDLPDAIVIASVDMSHYLPSAVADFHDDTTLRAIAAGGGDIDLEIDSNPSLQTLFAVNAARGTQTWHQTHHGSSLHMGAAKTFTDDTSHILGYFTAGTPIKDPFATLLFAGDVMLDRDVRVKIEQEGVEYPWKKMERFLRGTHLVVANLEGNVGARRPGIDPHQPPYLFMFDPKDVQEMHKWIDVVSLANNHTDDYGPDAFAQTEQSVDLAGVKHFGSPYEPRPRLDLDVNGVSISLIGYHAFTPNEAELESEIKKAKTEKRFVIVVPHWGTEYKQNPDVGQDRLVRLMAHAGADLVIGSHPHVIETVDVVDGMPVVYSMGNFIFDQKTPDTWRGLTVGVTITNDRVILHLIPVATKDGQPAPLEDEETNRLLSDIAGRSNPNLQSSISNGILTFPRL